MAGMRAITREHYGGPDVLRLTGAEVPEPGHDELLVRVEAGSPNAADWHMLTGEPLLLRPGKGLRAPSDQRFGNDVAGAVEAVGADVTGFVVGDRVFGATDFRGFAELAPMAAGRAARIPDGVDARVAATLPIAGVTALQAVREHAAVGPGDRVLVNGAAGGVGHFAVQVARLLGAEVTAVSSGRNHELVRRLGAHHVIDHTTRAYPELGGTYDAIVDLVGNHPAAANRRLLAEDGRWVIVSGPKGRVLGPLPYVARGLARFAVAPQRATMFVAEERTARLEQLAAWVAAGELAPSIERSFALPEVPDAMAHLGTGRTRGKLVVEVAGA